MYNLTVHSTKTTNVTPGYIKFTFNDSDNYVVFYPDGQVIFGPEFSEEILFREAWITMARFNPNVIDGQNAKSKMITLFAYVIQNFKKEETEEILNEMQTMMIMKI